MPARRSRTIRWRDCLQQILERGGGIELAVDQGRGKGEQALPDLLWRVRLRAIEPEGVLLDQPGAAGRPIPIEPGTPLVGAMSVGQNRWMFHSRALAANRSTLRIACPEGVERCSRRHQDRISTAALELPPVRAWPLTDPVSAVPAEVACRERVAAIRAGEPTDGIPKPAPEVGVGFCAWLLNVSSGGVGVLVPPNEAAHIESGKLHWLRLDLAPVLPCPLELSARLAHAQVDSGQNVRAGFAFEFGLNPPHKHFVADVLDSYLRFLTQHARRHAA